ncbi:hypothetical protein [Flavobacterium sp.]|jgi:hypothetical protein|uniref:hypothetical protein n=1 Tax=Flavobacterium sp. TaxID=239 RepID=UPI0037BEE255
METITIQELKDKLEASLKKLYVKDWYLLKHNCHERSITHKLAEYLQELLPDFDVDCEYNLDIDNNDTKRKKWVSEKAKEKVIEELKKIKESLNSDNWNLTEEIEKVSVNFYPDIIVHKRGSNKYNMLIIEAKKGNANASLDIEKLKAFTSQIGELHYRYLLGAQIKLDVEAQLNGKTFTNPTYYINGVAQ